MKLQVLLSVVLMGLAGMLAGPSLAQGSRPLRLEITEGVLIRDADAALLLLERLKALGVGIAMDDFGTGYSSLSYFRMFPFDKVKIDRAFTKGLAEDPKVNLIVRSIVSLAHSLQIRASALRSPRPRH